MPLIARRMRWLQLLFPPAEAAPPNPGSLSDDISLVHEVLPGTERLAEYQEVNVSGAAGVNLVVAPTVPDDKYWWVFAASMFHNDTVTTREAEIQLLGAASVTVAQAGRALPANIQLPAPRPFIVPSRVAVRATVAAIGGAFVVTLRMFYMELDPGEMHPQG